MQLPGRSQKLALDPQPSVVPGFRVGRPLDLPDLTVLELKTGDVPRVDATAGVEIGWRSVRSAHRKVGVTADNDLTIDLQPLDDLLFDPSLSSSHPLDDLLLDSVVCLALVVGSAHRPGEAEELERLPDIVHRWSAHNSALLGHKVDLMPVHDEHSLPGSGVAQDQPFVSNDSILIYLAAVSFALDIVVAKDEVQPIAPIKPMQQVKSALVGASDVIEPILIQLIPVADLDVGEALTIIVGQCTEKQVLVLGKGICSAVVPPMKIAEENDSGTIVEWDFFGCFEDPG